MSENNPLLNNENEDEELFTPAEEKIMDSIQELILDSPPEKRLIIFEILQDGYCSDCGGENHDDSDDDEEDFSRN